MVQYRSADSAEILIAVSALKTPVLTIAADKTSGIGVLDVAFTGRLTDPDDGSGIAGRAVVLFVDGTQTEAATTGTDGSYGIAHHFDALGADASFRCRAHFTGDGGTG